MCKDMFFSLIDLQLKKLGLRSVSKKNTTRSVKIFFLLTDLQLKIFVFYICKDTSQRSVAKKIVLHLEQKKSLLHLSDFFCLPICSFKKIVLALQAKRNHYQTCQEKFFVHRSVAKKCFRSKTFLLDLSAKKFTPRSVRKKYVSKSVLKKMVLDL